MKFHSHRLSFLSLLLLGLLPVPAAESAHTGKGVMMAGKSAVTAETATPGEKQLRGTRDAAELTPDLLQDLAPGPGPGPGRDQETAGVAGRHPGLDPVREKGKKSGHGRNSPRPPSEIRRNQSQKTGGDTGQGRAPGREEKKKGPPRILRNLQALVFRTRKTQKSHRPSRKRRKWFNAPTERRKWLQQEHRRRPSMRAI